MNKLSNIMVDSILWNKYEYPREFYGEDSPYNYIQPPPSCQQISQDVSAERDERRRRAIKRVQLRSDCHIWEQCCEEVAIERMELDHVLLSCGFPDSRHSKDKLFPERMYSTPPDINTCSAQDYLEYYIFPYVLTAITELIKFIQNHSILQCRVCTFAASDFISEYLYNHNPLHPRRQYRPVPIYETEMAKRCLKENPRPPLPKWLKMSKDDAAVIIQRAFRGFLVRRMENVQEMRQFWRDYKNDTEDVECDAPADELRELLAKYDQEDTAMHSHETNPNQPSKTHSQECDLCATFRKFIQRSKGRRKTRAKFAMSKPRDSEKNKFCYQDAAQGNLIAIPTTYRRHKGHPSLSCLVRAKCPTERTDSEIDLDVACAEYRGVPSISTIQSSVDLPAKHQDKNGPNNSLFGGPKATDSTNTDKVRVKSKKTKAK